MSKYCRADLNKLMNISDIVKMELSINEFLNMLFEEYINDSVDKYYRKNEKSPDVIFINNELFKKFSLKNVYKTRCHDEIFIVPNYNVSGISFEKYYGE